MGRGDENSRRKKIKTETIRQIEISLPSIVEGELGGGRMLTAKFRLKDIRGENLQRGILNPLDYENITAIQRGGRQGLKKGTRNIHIVQQRSGSTGDFNTQKTHEDRRPRLPRPLV